MASHIKSKPKYIKKKRRRCLNYKVLIPLLVILFLVGYGGIKLVSYVFNPKEVVNEFVIDGLSVEESKKILSNANIEDGEYELKDYVLYGESLTLYADTYDLGKSDKLSGKSILCRNLSTGSEYVYYLGSKLDEGIPIYELPVGVYEVYVSSLLSNERMYMNNETFEEFYTVTRKGITHRFSLIANTNYFYPNDETVKLEKPYLYFLVEDAELPDAYYDIIIDPGHFAYDCYSNSCWGYIDNGSITNNGTFIESEAVYQVSEVVAKELALAGLKVTMTRDNVTPVDMYGEGGRVYQTITSHAKYYISNHLNAINDTSAHGAEVWHSAYASSKLAETILDILVADTNLVASGNIGSGNPIPSIITSTVSADKYGKAFDGFMMIREPGGKGTGAGQISEAAIENNGPFLENVNYGANTVLIQYIYMTNKKDAAAWNDNYESYGKAVAKAIIEYLNLDFYENDFVNE